MIHAPESKLHSLPTTSPPFLLTRPSTTRHSPNLTNQVVLPFSNETSSRIFLASNHPTKPRTPGLPSPSKALASFNKAFKDKYSPSNRTIMTPNRNSGIIDDENTNLPLKMSLQEVKDDQGNCHVRFIRKPEKNGFRALLNRYKQENEAYPSILQSRTFEGEAVDFKLNSGRHTPTARSIIAKMLRKREDKVHENVKETSAEAAYNQAIKEAITNALPRRAPVVSHNRAKSVQIDVQSPVKQQNLPSASFSRPKTPAKIRVVLPTRQTRAQTATADDIKNMIEVSGLLQADRKLDSEQNEKRQYYLNKVPLLKELSGVEAESHLHNRYAKRPRNKGKLHPFAMSLSYTQSPIGSIKDKLSSSGFEKWSVVGSSKQIEQTRTSMDRQKKERTTLTNGFMNLGAIKDWLDVLTVKGNVVTPSQPQDVVLENSQGPPPENREAHLTQKSLCSSRKQRAEDRVKNQPEIKITRFSMTPKPRREDIKKEVKSVVLAQRKKSADIVEKVIKGVVVLPKKMSFSMEKEAKEKGEKKEKDAWQDNFSGVGLDGWEVSPTHENFDKICLDERIDTVQSKNDDVQTEEL